MSIVSSYPNILPIEGYNFVKTRSVPPNLQYSRASTGTYVGSDGLIKTARAGEPRFNHSPTTGESLGLLVEEARTNLALRSEELGALGIYGAGVITNNFGISPSGLLNARRLSPGAGTGPHGATFYNGNAYAPDGWQISAYVKPLGLPKLGIRVQNGTWGNQYSVCTIDFNTLTFTNTAFGGTQSFTGQSVADVGNGWYRIQWRWFYSVNASSTISFVCGISTSANDNNTPASWNFDGTPYVNNGFLIWGIQIENAAFPTSYIPTVASTVTRAADTLSPIILPNSNSSTILVETESTINATPILSLNDSTSTNEIRLLNHPLAGGSSVVDSFGPAATSAGGSRLYKSTTALSVDNDQIQVVSDNAVSNSTTISSSNLNQLRIGSTVSGTALNGTIKKLYVYDQPFSPLVLKSLTIREETTPFPPANEPNFTMAVSITSPNTTWNLRSTGTVNYDVDWGDGQIETTQTSNTKAHTYVSPGIYKVVVKIRSGVFRPFYNNNVDAERIVSIFSTGTGWTFGTSLDRAWYRGFNVVFVDEGLDTSTITDFSRAWGGCRSLLSFPLINTSSGTTFGGGGVAVGCWYNCTGLTSFPLLDFSSATSLAGAWANCSGLTSFPAINTTSVTRFGEVNPLTGAWQGCSSLTSFPLIDTSNATSIARAWEGCSNLAVAFPNINTSNCQNFYNTWKNCSSLTSFPALDFSSATGNLGGGSAGDGTWRNCSGLTSFPFINISGINGSVAGAWAGCSSLTQFPLLDFSNVTAFGARNQGGWQGCSSLTSFPLIDTSKGIFFERAWDSCSNLTSFPSLNISLGTQFFNTWRNCSGLTSFPALDFSSAVGDLGGVSGGDGAWRNCSGLTEFPFINLSNVTGSIAGAWAGCTGLTEFPLLDLSKVTSFGEQNQGAWMSCTGLTSFPSINMSSGIRFRRTWLSCTNLANFPPNRFDTCIATDFTDCWNNCALTAQSIENILVSINTAGQSNGILHVGGGTNAIKSTWTTAANTAYDALIARGWTITFRA